MTSQSQPMKLNMKNIRIIDVRAKDGDSAFLIDDGKTAIVYDSGFAFTGFEVVENILYLLFF